MNCQNCGAPMKLDLHRRSFTCPYCTSVFFPEESADGIRNSGVPGKVACPLCRIPMLLAWIDTTEVLYCGKCRGLFIPQGAFLVTLRYLRARPVTAPADPVRFNPEELKRALHCPLCNRRMDTHPYGGPGNVVVDNCLTCNMLWLDYRELNRITSAPGRDRADWV